MVWGKEENKQYLKAHYQKNKEYYANKRDRYRKSVKEKVNTLKNIPCMDCKGKFPPYCMDFDHKENKIKEISTMIQQGKSFENILLEIKKCDLVCSNCHRIRTWNRIIRNGAIGNTPDFESGDSRIIP